MLINYKFKNSNMKQYVIGKNIPLENLRPEGRLSLEDYTTAHEGLILPYHDIYVEHNKGILLVRRREEPAKGILWPLGGRLERGMSMEDSLAKKVKDESGLDFEDGELLGEPVRVFSSHTNLDHPLGTDALALVYFGRGKGILNLNSLHEEPTLVTSGTQYEPMREGLHPYVRDFMDMAMERL
jgi:hypothetical protein